MPTVTVHVPVAGATKVVVGQLKLGSRSGGANVHALPCEARKPRGPHAPSIPRLAAVVASMVSTSTVTTVPASTLNVHRSPTVSVHGVMSSVALSTGTPVRPQAEQAMHSSSAGQPTAGSSHTSVP